MHKETRGRPTSTITTDIPAESKAWRNMEIEQREEPTVIDTQLQCPRDEGANVQRESGGKYSSEL